MIAMAWRPRAGILGERALARLGRAKPSYAAKFQRRRALSGPVVAQEFDGIATWHGRGDRRPPVPPKSLPPERSQEKIFSQISTDHILDRLGSEGLAVGVHVSGLG